ncbi:hypothetical protein P3U41_05725 [Mammaliicoccus sciuri]|uniref:hypothetical protein n=1 Tax=Mammaliicoccus sciuri TaxID=1296 RepID=UPI002B25CBD3|nr:hypothetical protein [Mammaliicoccus sciuri]WQL34268.1 hypothetical protein P3U41_05725 [Mammaliicoccus sciuri]WQL61207.1 hypothetical protein P3T96_05725 [Mammaliicoccus sciuri]
MVKVKIENHYHNETEIVEGATLEEVKQNHIEGLEFTAENLTESEISEDEDYNEYYNIVLEQLVSEVSFTVVK